jgi:hypothetical protein
VCDLFKSKSDAQSCWRSCGGLATKHTRGNFRLPVEQQRIVRGRGPKRCSRSMRFFAGDKQPTARNVQRFANLGSLTEGRSPAKSYREAEPHALMLAARHFSNHTAGRRWCKSKYMPELTKQPRPRTRTKIPEIRVAVWLLQCYVSSDSSQSGVT